jgi:hypothetical protein
MGGYRSGRTLAWVVTAFLLARVGTDVVALAGQAVVTFVLGESLETYPDPTDPTFLASALLLTIGGLGQLLAFLAAAVAFLAWFHRASVNAHQFAPDSMQYGAGWAIGGFFVPFLNLVRPYQIARDIEAVGSRSMMHSSLLGAWWGAFVIDNFMGNLEFRLVGESTDQTTVFAVMTVTSITGAIAAFFCWRSVWYLENLLAERARSPEDIAAVFT